jgi:hypothetical protein
LAVEVPMARSVPAFSCGLDRGQRQHAHVDLAADHVGHHRPMPLYGMWRAVTPASSMNISPARCMMVPLPDDA